MCRVIALARPTWVIGENVTGLVAMALDDVLFDLEGLGYTARTFVIPACAVGAPHRRDRLWFVAYANGKQHEGSTPENQRTTAKELLADASGSRLEGPRDERGTPGGEGSRQSLLSGEGNRWDCARPSSCRHQWLHPDNGVIECATCGETRNHYGDDLLNSKGDL